MRLYKWMKLNANATGTVIAQMNETNEKAHSIEHRKRKTKQANKETNKFTVGCARCDSRINCNQAAVGHFKS